MKARGKMKTRKRETMASHEGAPCRDVRPAMAEEDARCVRVYGGKRS